MSSSVDSKLGHDRYHRQMLLPGLGPDGQERLRAARVLLVGCGALGSVLAETLARAGVGHLRIIDRDLVEITNLQRQFLFDEADVRAGLPKAAAAKARIQQINGEVDVEAVVVDFGPGNAQRLVADCDLLLDGTDNFETRFLLNDLAIAAGLPYVYGGAVGTAGMSYVVLPHTAKQDRAWERAELAGPCLRCIFDDAPPPGTTPTCDTAGVLGPVAAIVANMQAIEAIKLLSGNLDAVNRTLRSFDGWTNAWRETDVSRAWEAGECIACGRHQFEYLDGDQGSRTITLCGRNAVQVAPVGQLDFDAVAHRLTDHTVACNDYLLRAAFQEREQRYELTLFRDGRALIHGTADAGVARSIYARYIGS